MNIEELMHMTKEREATDLIITSGCAPTLRINKKLVFTKLPPLSPQQIDALVDNLLNQEQKESFKKVSELSFIHSLSGWGRFRVTLFKQRGSTGIAIRRFPFALASAEELHLPVATLEYFCNLNDGLVLVTGPAGGGKSTTLACMIRMMNEKQPMHIVTIEEPIEYLFKHNKSVIEQRAIPYDSPSFATALKETLRLSPDIVVVGEIRDQETLRHTLRVAEAGILVFATFHTATATDTLNRLINFFPQEEEQLKIQLSMILRGILSQQLVPLANKPGMVPAWEVFVVNERVMPVIRDGNVQQIHNIIETGSRFGMQSMDQTLVSLYDRKLISKETLSVCLRRRDADSISPQKKLTDLPEE